MNIGRSRRTWAGPGAIVIALLAAAPTAGDIGSSCQPLVVLDHAKFFAAKQSVDCEKCMACALTSNACTAACGKKPVAPAFPKDCFPLVHDGEVCIRALSDASCADYALFVADQGAIIPTECDFCPADKAPPGVGGSGGTSGSESTGSGG